MRNNFKYLKVLLLICGGILFINVSCKNSSSKNRKDYLSYKEDGFVRKYFDSTWSVVHYISDAYYYREAYYYNGHIVTDSITKDYYINGSLQFAGHLLSESPDKIVGKGIWYHPNGQIAMKYEADDSGKIQGECLCYYEDGSLRANLYYQNDTIVELTSFSNTGKVTAKGTFNSEDLFSGTYYYYYENDELSEVAPISVGLREGISIEYYKSGAVKCEKSYHCDVLHGDYVSYYDNGQLMAKGKYNNNMRTGIWVIVDESGNVTRQNYSMPKNQFAYNGFNNRRRHSFSPDDAYDDGYDNGYEQGKEDGARHHSYGYNYDNSSDYYNHYETKYEEGYEAGYEEGYDEGRYDK